MSFGLPRPLQSTFEPTNWKASVNQYARCGYTIASSQKRKNLFNTFLRNIFLIKNLYNTVSGLMVTLYLNMEIQFVKPSCVQLDYTASAKLCIWAIQFHSTMQFNLTMQFSSMIQLNSTIQSIRRFKWAIPRWLPELRFQPALPWYESHDAWWTTWWI